MDENKKIKVMLIYRCTCKEKLLCSDSQLQGWKRLVGVARTHCQKHQVASPLQAVGARKE
jgi:hypothetical protein